MPSLTKPLSGRVSVEEPVIQQLFTEHILCTQAWSSHMDTDSVCVLQMSMYRRKHTWTQFQLS
jgi:hypothetical protein